MQDTPPGRARFLCLVAAGVRLVVSGAKAGVDIHCLGRPGICPARRISLARLPILQLFRAASRHLAGELAGVNRPSRPARLRIEDLRVICICFAAFGRDAAGLVIVSAMNSIHPSRMHALVVARYYLMRSLCAVNERAVVGQCKILHKLLAMHDVAPQYRTRYQMYSNQM